MSNGRKLLVPVAFLVCLHTVVSFAGFFSPYDFAAQNRSLPLAPPTRLHFVDMQGRLHLRPFIYQWMPRAGGTSTYEEDRSVAYSLEFLVRRSPYTIMGGKVSRWHLFGVDEAARVFLLGSDEYGRDQLSRLLSGAQISLFAGLLGAAISLSLGMALGAFAGFCGGWLDEAIMRGAELFLALPWLYLLLAVRAFLPLHISPAQVFLLLTTVVGLIGWARPARLVRGVVLSAKQRDYVLAARGFGASGVYLLRRHVLPETLSVCRTQAVLLVPQYILAEVTMSFLGLGVNEPAASLGNMLASLQHYHVLASHWWMFLPGLTLIPIFLAYYSLAAPPRPVN
jgi:peptide/nickel transport system permease protein